MYENGILKSITHPEGYIEQENDGSYTYVYEHRDIWQNTRITYADDNKNGSIETSEIRREQNHYPFGMEWEGINTNIRHAKNNLKTYQGQELTEDLGLNTHEWRYRMSDRSIGRFWQVDPLAEDYMYNSTYAFQENKMGMGVELEGLEFVGWEQLALSDAVSNPNGVSAHAIGIAEGVVNSAKGTIDAVTNPVQTVKGIGNLAVVSALQGNPAMMMQADAALGTNSLETAAAVGEAAVQGATDLVSGDGVERGNVIGQIGMAVVGAKGTTAVTKAVTTTVKANMSTKVFRAFGGDAKANGFSWTPKDPTTVPNFRDVAGLPSGGASGAMNTAESLIQGTVKNKNIIKKRAALPLDGNRGGLPEYIIDPKNVKVNSSTNLNPNL